MSANGLGPPWHYLILLLIILCPLLPQALSTGEWVVFILLCSWMLLVTSCIEALTLDRGSDSQLPSLFTRLIQSLRVLHLLWTTPCIGGLFVSWHQQHLSPPLASLLFQLGFWRLEECAHWGLGSAPLLPLSCWRLSTCDALWRTLAVAYLLASLSRLPVRGGEEAGGEEAGGEEAGGEEAGGEGGGISLYYSWEFRWSAQCKED